MSSWLLNWEVNYQPRSLLKEELQAGQVPTGCSVVSRNGSTVRLHLSSSSHGEQPADDLLAAEAGGEVERRGPRGVLLLETRSVRHADRDPPQVRWSWEDQELQADSCKSTPHAVSHLYNCSFRISWTLTASPSLETRNTISRSYQEKRACDTGPRHLSSQARVLPPCLSRDAPSR